MADPKKNDPRPSEAPKGHQQAEDFGKTIEEKQRDQIKELEAKLAAQAERDDGRKTTRGLTPSIQALATIDTALRKLRAEGEGEEAVRRVVAWIAQEWLPANKPMTNGPRE